MIVFRASPRAIGLRDSPESSKASHLPRTDAPGAVEQDIAGPNPIVASFEKALSLKEGVLRIGLPTQTPARLGRSEDGVGPVAVIAPKVRQGRFRVTGSTVGPWALGTLTSRHPGG